MLIINYTKKTNNNSNNPNHKYHILPFHSWVEINLKTLFEF